MLRVMPSEGPSVVPQENKIILSAAITLLMLKNNSGHIINHSPPLKNIENPLIYKIPFQDCYVLLCG